MIRTNMNWTVKNLKTMFDEKETLSFNHPFSVSQHNGIMPSRVCLFIVCWRTFLYLLYMYIKWKASKQIPKVSTHIAILSWMENRE